jgi:hypothetical protein
MGDLSQILPFSVNDYGTQRIDVNAVDPSEHEGEPSSTINDLNLVRLKTRGEWMVQAL